MNFDAQDFDESSTSVAHEASKQTRTNAKGAPEHGFVVDPSYVLNEVERASCELVEIDSPSFHEREMADEMRRRLESIGFTVVEDATKGRQDDSIASLSNTRRFGQLSTTKLAYQRLLHTGSDCGNLFATLPGRGALADADPILFITHLDTVLPAHDKHAVVHADGTITSKGDTVLGADDIAALAIMLVAVKDLERRKADHRPVELACMVAEEVGNVGARAFDFSQCKASMAYTLDYSADPNEYAYQAPTIQIFTAEVLGHSAHAGFYPEKGIHAIKIAARAIDQIECGRVGDDTTVNIGMISGGRGNNVVPGTCVMRGEVRSYDHEKSVRMIEGIRETFERAAEEFGGKVTFQVKEACRAYSIGQDAPVIARFRRACELAGLPEASGKPTFGGSDNNVCVANGIPGIVIANGMREAHSTSEHVLPGDLLKIQRVVENLLTI
ncbi:MAG: M20/M25/M40 family metallo-hydrolase [Coriobacteriales bacterium]|jgi:tripeptide aminopeptidase